MKIDEVKASFEKGILRSNRFKMLGAVVPPTDMVNYLVSVNIPGVTFDTFTWKNEAHGIKKPNVAVFNEVTTTWMDDDSGGVRSFFEDQINKVYDRETGRFFYADDYMMDFSIQQLDRWNNPVWGVALFNAWVSSISDVDLSHATNDTPSTFQVVYTYSYWNKI